MKILVVYSSKTGFTKRYAEWIAEELACSTLSYENFSENVVKENDVIIFGSRIHAGKIDHLKKIKSYFHDGSKKLIVFATGGTPCAAEEAINGIWKNNFTETEVDKIPHFYFQSGINYEKMGFSDRTIMKMVAFMLGKTKEKSDDEAGFEQAIRNSYDKSSKEYIMPLVDYVNDNFHVET